jgi:hypothetical protein
MVVVPSFGTITRTAPRDDTNATLERVEEIEFPGMMALRDRFLEEVEDLQ